MNVTVTIRIPVAAPVPRAALAPAKAPVTLPAASQATADTTAARSPARALHALLPLIEPAALLIAEAAGLGLIDKIVCATVLRFARQVLAAEAASTA